MKSTINILDVVATRKAFPDHNILDGQVGTVVEILKEGFVEVEFSLKKEEDAVLIPIHKDELMRLHFALEEA